MPVPFQYLTYPRETALTTVARFVEETGSTADSALIARLIDRTTSEIESKLGLKRGRRLGRGEATDRFEGTGLREQVLDLMPLVEIEAVRKNGAAQDLSRIEPAPSGGSIVLNPDSFAGTFNRPLWEVDYWAGYLMPSDDISSSAVSALASDNSFNLSSGQWPYLRAGDWVKVAGFTLETVLNTRHKVASRTATKLIVETAIASDDPNTSPNNTITVQVQTLPGDLERACVLLVLDALEPSAADAAGLVKVSERVGDLAVSYSESQTRTSIVGNLLRPFARMG